MSKYDEEMERRENKIVTLKYKRDQQLERFQYLDDEVGDKPELILIKEHMLPL